LKGGSLKTEGNKFFHQINYSLHCIRLSIGFIDGFGCLCHQYGDCRLNIRFGLETIAEEIKWKQRATNRKRRVRMKGIIRNKMKDDLRNDVSKRKENLMEIIRMEK
jgi:hypothetical protein